MHAWVPTIPSIGLLSLAAVQTFEYARYHLFQWLHSRVACLRVATFAHVPSAAVVYLFQSTPIIRANGDIELNDTNYAVWDHLLLQKDAIIKSSTLLGKRVAKRS